MRTERLRRDPRHGGRIQLVEIGLMSLIAVLMFWLMATALPSILVASVYGIGLAVAVLLAVREADRYVCAQRAAYRCQSCRRDAEQMEVSL